MFDEDFDEDEFACGGPLETDGSYEGIEESMRSSILYNDYPPINDFEGEY